MRRLRLPARYYGGGMRAVADLCPAAFVGTLCRALPGMIASTSAAGDVRTGFLECLSPLVGAGSFDESALDLERPRFRSLDASGCRLGLAFARCWAEMQAEVGTETLQILAVPVDSAGACADKVQRALTHCRERARFHVIDAEVRALAHEDPPRLAFIHCDRFSTVWVSA